MGTTLAKADIEAAVQLQPRFFPPLRGELCRYWHEILAIRPLQAIIFQNVLNNLFLMVCALCMANVIDNHHVALITDHDVSEGAKKLKQNRCADKNGLTGDCLKAACLSDEVCADLASKFESRSVSAPQVLEQWQKEVDEDSWYSEYCCFIPKNSSITDISEFRPIAILDVILKLYLVILFGELSEYIKFNNYLQFGARKFHQCTEVIHIIRLLSEKCLLWGMSLIIISLDVAKAYDCLDLQAVIDIMDKYAVPIRLRFAILREVLAIKAFTFSCLGETVGPFPILRGLRQGSPLSSFLFSIIIGDILSSLDSIWKQKGMGIKLGRFGGNDLAFSEFWEQYHDCFKYIDIDSFHDLFFSCLGFLDDVYIFADSVSDAQCMLDDLCKAFLQVGLVLNPSKVKWTMNKHARASAPYPQHLVVSGVLVSP